MYIYIYTYLHIYIHIYTSVQYSYVYHTQLVASAVGTPWPLGGALEMRRSASPGLCARMAQGVRCEAPADSVLFEGIHRELLMGTWVNYSDS